MALNHNILLEVGTNEFEIVEFIIETYKPFHFCINVAKVREVILMPEVVQVPDAHEAIVGTANIRQDLVPIIDLGYWLGLRERRQDIAKCKVIVTFFNHQSNGFLVDEVVRIHRITWNEIKDYSAITDMDMVEAVLGVVNIGGRMIQLLDFETIVSDIHPMESMENAVIDMTKHDLRQQYSVYIAEDSPVIRRALISNFNRSGYNIQVFENGNGLLKALEKKKPDLIITDMEMPVASGDYVVKKAREHFKPKALPIIVFSSMYSEENERKLLKLGADRFVGKPEMSLLVALVDEFLL